MTQDQDEALERAIEAEVERLADMTVRDLVSEYQLVRARLSEVTGSPRGCENPTIYGFDLGAIVEALAMRNLGVEP